MPPADTGSPDRPAAPGIGPVVVPKKNPKGREDMCLMHDLFLHVCFKYDPQKYVRRVLGVILGLDLRLVEVNQQAEMKSLEHRSVIMDFLAVDENGKRYNIEVQADLSGADPHRPRYHLCVIDLGALQKGQPFSELPDACSIFLVPGDPFNPDNPRPLYVFTRRTEDGVPLGDGTTIIYVNVLYQDLRTELGRLCRDFCCSDPNDMYFPELKEIVTLIKTTPKGEERMSSIIAELESKAELRGELRGREEGREQGRRETNRDIAARMLGLGMSLELIAQSLGLPQDEVRLMAEQLRGA